MVHNTMNRAGLKIPKNVWMFVEGPCGKFNRDITPASADDENTPYHSTRHHCVVLACRQYHDGFPLLHTQPIPKISVMICQHHAPFSQWSVSAARPSRRVRVVGGHGGDLRQSVCYVISSYDLTKTLVATSLSLADAGTFASQCVLDGSASLR